MLDQNRRPTPRELRQFAALWLPLNAAAIGTMLWWLTQTLAAAAVVWTLAAAVCLIGLWRPAWVRPVFWVWTAFGLLMGGAVTFVVLAAVFYLVITPVGVILRLLGRDALRRRFEPESPTYWSPVPPEEDGARYFRQF